MAAYNSGGLFLRHHGRRVLALPRPDRRDRQKVGNVQRVQEIPANVSITVTRKASPPGLDRVHRFDAARESDMLQGLHDRAGGLIQAFDVFIHADDVRAVPGEMYVAGTGDAHRLFGIAGHLGRIEVYGAAFGFENLIAPAADLRPPLLPRLVEDGFGLLCVQHHRAGVGTDRPHDPPSMAEVQGERRL